MFNVTKVNWHAKGVNYKGQFDGHLNLLQVRDKLVSPARPREQRTGMDGIRSIIHVSPGVPDKQFYGLPSVKLMVISYLRRNERCAANRSAIAPRGGAQ